MLHGDECKTMKSLFTQCHKNFLLFCIDSVMVILLQCVGLMFMKSFFYPHICNFMVHMFTGC